MTTDNDRISINTQRETEPVDINGVSYRMIRVDEFGLREIKKFEHLSNMVAVWGSKELQDLQDDEVDALERVLFEAIPLILPDIEDELSRSLTTMDRLTIANRFLVVSGYGTVTNRRIRRATTTKTQGASRQRFKGSTVAQT